MFLFLHRLCKLLVAATFAAAAAGIWQQRETLMPAWDFTRLWIDSFEQPPADPIRLEGTVTSVPTETSLVLRDAGGTSWHCGYVGLVAVMPQQRAVIYPEKVLIKNTLTNQAAWLKGKRISFRATVVSPLHTAVGVAELEGSSVNLRLVSEGRVSLDAERLRVLPVREQVALLTAERRARREQLGRWHPDIPQPPSATRRESGG